MAPSTADATKRPPLYASHFFAPVLDTFMWAMPHAYRNTEATTGTVVEVEITGDACGRWFLRRDARSWELLIAADRAPSAGVSISQAAAWRLFTKGMLAEQARSLSKITGYAELAGRFFRRLRF